MTSCITPQERRHEKTKEWKSACVSVWMCESRIERRNPNFRCESLLEGAKQQQIQWVRDGERERVRASACACVCVCVCTRERERRTNKFVPIVGLEYRQAAFISPNRNQKNWSSNKKGSFGSLSDHKDPFSETNVWENLHPQLRTKLQALERNRDALKLSILWQKWTFQIPTLKTKDVRKY